MHEYFRLVLHLWEVCPLSECPLLEVSLSIAFINSEFTMMFELVIYHMAIDISASFHKFHAA